MGKYSKYFEIYKQINKLKQSSFSVIMFVEHPYWQRSLKQRMSSENGPLLVYYLVALSATVIV